MARKEKYYTTKAESLKYTCCFCGKGFTGWGNDPWPVKDNRDNLCCDTCNMEVVIPARMNMLLNRGNNGKTES